jgi:hypothetical protein
MKKPFDAHKLVFASTLPGAGTRVAAEQLAHEPEEGRLFFYCKGN